MAQPLFLPDTVQRAMLLELVNPVQAGIVSRTLVALPCMKQVLFAFDAGQELSSHRTAMLAFVQVLDGKIRMNVAGREYSLGPSDWLLMPPDVPHDVRADEPARMLLTMVKPSAPADAT